MAHMRFKNLKMIINNKICITTYVLMLDPVK